MEKKTDIEKLLMEGNIIQIKPRGWSMYPTLQPGRDYAVIAPVGDDKLKWGDVVLFRREGEGGILVLHRICGVSSDGLCLVGDNQVEVEGPIKAEQVKGRLTAFIRNGKTISVGNPVYRACAAMWLLMRPVRPLIKKPAAWIKRKLGKH